jgi:hypothetical protein
MSGFWLTGADADWCPAQGRGHGRVLTPIPVHGLKPDNDFAAPQDMGRDGETVFLESAHEITVFCAEMAAKEIADAIVAAQAEILGILVQGSGQGLVAQARAQGSPVHLGQDILRSKGVGRKLDTWQGDRSDILLRVGCQAGGGKGQKRAGDNGR